LYNTLPLSLGSVRVAVRTFTILIQTYTSFHKKHNHFHYDNNKKCFLHTRSTYQTAFLRRTLKTETMTAEKDVGNQWVKVKCTVLQS